MLRGCVMCGRVTSQEVCPHCKVNTFSQSDLDVALKDMALSPLYGTRFVAENLRRLHDTISVDVLYVDEWCPHCDTEVKIPTGRKSACPNCGVFIKPCAECDIDVDCSNCRYGADSLTREEKAV